MWASAFGMPTAVVGEVMLKVKLARQNLGDGLEADSVCALLRKRATIARSSYAISTVAGLAASGVALLALTVTVQRTTGSVLYVLTASLLVAFGAGLFGLWLLYAPRYRCGVTLATSDVSRNAVPRDGQLKGPDTSAVLRSLRRRRRVERTAMFSVFLAWAICSLVGLWLARNPGAYLH